MPRWRLCADWATAPPPTTCLTTGYLYCTSCSSTSGRVAAGGAALAHPLVRAELCGERLLPPEVDPRDDWRPAPADELAALLLFYARDGFLDLRLASDLSAWWDLYGADLPPGALGELLHAYPALARVVAVAAAAAEQTVGLPASHVIDSMHELGLCERMAVRLANPNPRSSRSQLYADIGLIDGLLMPAGGFGAFVRRQLLPPSEVLDQQARHAARQRARSPLGRGTGVLARYGLTMTRMLRGPETLG